jgi:aldose 1-epimerase
VTTPARDLVASSPLGHLPDGREVTVVALRNGRGFEAVVSTHGGTLLAFRVPDRSGGHTDVVLGVDGVERPPKWPYFGAIIGRYANRIAFGRFALEGRPCAVTINNGAHHLHGGIVGWDQAVWRAEPFEETSRRGVRLSHTSPDGDQGFRRTSCRTS